MTERVTDVLVEAADAAAKRERGFRPGGDKVGRFTRRRVAVLMAIAVVAVTACQGKVADPVGDAYVSEFTFDLVEAGVDYRSDVTTLWLRYTPDSDRAAAIASGLPLREVWNLANYPYQPTAESPQALGVNLYGGQTMWINDGNGGSGDCLPAIGGDGNETVTLTFATSCLKAPDWSSLQFFGSVVANYEYDDYTAWSDPVARYP